MGEDTRATTPLATTAGGPVLAGDRQQQDPARWVVGVEVEYAVVQAGPAKLHHPGAVVVRRANQDDTTKEGFTPSGGRCYTDVGDHPEIATPECLTVSDVVAYDLAGQQRLADATVRVAAERHAPLALVRANLDAAGTPFGAHENFQVPREHGPEGYTRLAQRLLAFLAVRPLLFGTGVYLGAGHFRLAQRSHVTEVAVGAGSTRQRPMLSSRDEPLADRAAWRRLHVVCGDVNRNPAATWLKLATTRMVVATAVLDGSRLDPLTLDDPVDAFRTVSEDRSGTALLRLTSGRRIAAHRLLEELHDVCAASAAAAALPEAATATERWRQWQTALTADGWTGLVGRADWATKLALIDSLAARGTNDARLVAAGHLYHDLRAGSDLYLRGRRGAPSPDDDLHPTPAAVEAARHAPPTTRAAARSQLLRAAWAAGVTAAANWDRVAFDQMRRTDPTTATVWLADPACADLPDRARQVLHRLAA